MKPIKSGDATPADIRAQLPQVVNGVFKEEEPETTPSPDLKLPAATQGPKPPAGPVEPGDYKADGDPYTYRANPDGSVTIVDGPTGEGTTLKAGDPINAAITSQMRSGQLKKTAGAPAGLAEDRPGMNSHLDSSLSDLAGDSIRRHMKDS